MFTRIIKPLQYLIKNYLDLLLFYAFIVSIPFGKRHIFNLSESTLGGQFIEWKAFSLYLSDIVFILMLLFWITRIFTIQYKKTKYKCQIKYQKINIYYFVIIIVIFLLLSLLSVIQSDYLSLSFYKYVKLIEVSILFIFIIKNISSIPRLITSLFCFAFAGLIQSIIAILQFIYQHSLNLHIFGEQVISPDKLNVAKIYIDGERIIRAYGTMPHANVLGGYLFVSIIISAALLFISTLNKPINRNVPRGTFFEKYCHKMFHVEQSPYLAILSHKYFQSIIFLIITIQFIGFILTFSFSAYIALPLSLMIFSIIYIIIPKNNIRNFYSKFKRIFISNAYLYIFIIFIFILTIIIFIPQISSKITNINNVDDYPVIGRIDSIKAAYTMLLASPEFGTGPGTFTLEMRNLSEYSGVLDYWKINPVHNVLLLVAAELGITCLLLLILLIISLIVRSYIALDKAIFPDNILLSTFIVILIGIFIIFQLDHYFWTIQQGFLSLWLIISLTAVSFTHLKRI